MKSTTMTFTPGRVSSRLGRWLLGSAVILVLALGWRYPYLGLMVPLVMATGMAWGWFRGRYVCGNLCPRGAFLDSWLAPFAGRRAVPAWMRSSWFRGLVVAVLMSFMAWRLSLQIDSLVHWGTVFWQMCLITTVVAITLGGVYRERAWCSICPMGSIQAAEGRGKHLLQVDASCRECRLCEKGCPMDLPILAARIDGKMFHHDCIKCSQCQGLCPSNALSWPQTTS